MNTHSEELLISLGSLWDSSVWGILVIDEEGRIKKVNQEFQRRTGIDEIKYKSDGIGAVLTTENADRFYQALEQAIAQQDATTSVTFLLQDMEMHMVLTPANGFRGASSSEKWIVVLAQFYKETETTRVESDVQKKIEDLSYVLNELSAYAILTLDGIMLDANKQLERMLEFSNQDLVGKKYDVFINDGGWSQEHFDFIQNTLVDGHVWRGEVETRRKGKNGFWANMTLIPLLNGLGVTERVLAFFADISKEKMLKDQIEFLAYHDETTGLKNRNYLRDHY